MFNLVQEEEILALASIYEEELKVDPSGQGGFFYPPVVVPDGITVSYNWEGKKEAVTLNHLPPLCLRFNLHEDYPSRRPPQYVLSCIWLTLEQLSNLCDRLEELWIESKGLVVLFQWVQFLTEDLLAFLNVESELDITPLMIQFFKAVSECCMQNIDVSQKTNGKAVQANPRDNSVMVVLIDFNKQQEEKIFKKSLFDCEICFSEYSGSICMKFEACGHVFCKECCRNYFNSKIGCGAVQSINCPSPSCSTELMPHHVSACLDPEDYSKYEKLLMQSSLETMHDVTYCPRKQCSFPVLKDPNSNLGSCQSCSFFFCTVCFKGYHGVAPCDFNNANLKEIMEEYLKGTPSEQKALADRYGAKRLQSMANEYRSVAWLNENSQQCPKCSISIQKLEGCNKVVCSSCYCVFCWICNRVLDSENPYKHFRSGSCMNRLFEADINFEEQFFEAFDEDERNFLDEPDLLEEHQLVLEEENQLHLAEGNQPDIERNQLVLEEQNQLAIDIENQPAIGEENQPVLGEENQPAIGEDQPAIEENQPAKGEENQPVKREENQPAQGDRI